MTYDQKIVNIIRRLKQVKASQPELTLQKIADHTGVSLSTVTRVFADGSESQSFRYESIRPVAQMLLGLDNLDEGDDYEKALKAIIQLKDATIRQLEQAIAEEKEKHERKLEKERTQNRASIDFLKHQVELKDERITLLLNAVKDGGASYQSLHDQHMKVMSQLLDNKDLINKILEKGV